ncbi:unnamed protein product, partial [Allacma fusca]
HLHGLNINLMMTDIFFLKKMGKIWWDVSKISANYTIY